MTTGPLPRLEPGRALLHPAWWFALALLVVNDHGLKGSGLLDAVITGKLSDFAGLAMAPVLFATVLRVKTRFGFWMSHLFVGGVFSVFELSGDAARALVTAGSWIGLRYVVVPDITDLLALCSLPVSIGIFMPLADGRRAQGQSGFHAAAQAWRRLVKAGGVGVGLAATLGTSRLPPNTPVVTKEAVHVVHEERLYTLAAASGRVLRQVASAVRSVPDGSFVVGDVLCAATGGYALESGRLLWQHPPALETAFDGERLLILRDHQFDFVDPVTGALLRRHAGGRDLAISESFALIRDRHGGLVLYDLAGATARAVKPIAEPDAALAGNGGRFYFAEDERILVLDPRTLQVRSKNISSSMSFPPSFLRGTNGALLAYVRNFWGRTALVAMDPFELRELWSENDLRVSATTSQLVFSSVQTTLVATDVRSGQRRWRHSVGGNSETLGVAASEELLVTQDHAGVIVGVDIQSGERRWRTELVRTQ